MLTDRGWSNKKFSLSSSPKSNIITKEYFAMIHTILDTDLYKFTTSYAYIKLFPYAMGTFSFKDRDDTAYTDTFLKELQEAVDSLAQTVLTAEELEYMTRHLPFPAEGLLGVALLLPLPAGEGKHPSGRGPAPEH